MNNHTDALDEITGTLAGVLAEDDIRVLAGDDLLGRAGALERLGRQIDAGRVAVAGEISERSRVEHGSEGLAAKKGCRNANLLLQRVTLVSASTAEKRMRLGQNTRTHLTLTGHEQPARFPQVAEALTSGALGVDSAGAIVRGLLPALGVGAIDAFVAAERELVAAATGTGPDTPVPFAADEMRIQAQLWQSVLDPDGTDNVEKRAMAKRGLRLGRERDGIVPMTGSLMPEIAAKLNRLFDACLAPKTAPAFLAKAERESEELTQDHRSPEQQRHDIFAALIDGIARSGNTPTIGGGAPTVLVSVRQSDLERGHGAGYIDGSNAPISMLAVKQFVCAGGTQQVVLNKQGKIIELGSPQRCFTPQQRRAIMLRDGGCIIPGCNVPAAWTEIHHVDEAANGGPTHTDNGVCLCWFDHRMLESSGWQIRMVRGSPQIKAPPWIEPDGPWRPITKSRTRLADGIESAL